MEYTAHTAILGAGITGLCAAHSLQQNGKSVQIFEASDHIGGALQTTIESDYLAEHGPNSILIKDRRVATLLNQIHLPLSESEETILARDEAKKRYIVQNGQPHPMPSSPLGMLLTPLFSASGKLRFALEPFVGRYKGQEEESFASFVRRRLGNDMLSSAAGPFVSGIYAGDPENLSVRHAFPRLWNLEHNYRSFILGAIALQFGIGPGGKNLHRLAPAQMISFKSGMHSLPLGIAKHLRTGSVRLSCGISSIEKCQAGWSLTWSDNNGKIQTGKFKNLIIATPHHVLPNLPIPEDVATFLKPITAVESPPVTSLVLGFKREDIAHPLDGFGMLIKQAENSPLLGVLFSSSMFDSRAPDGHVTLTCMMGGSLNPQFADNTEQIVLNELNRLLGVTGAPTFRHRKQWQHAIPQYDLHYQKVINALESCEKQHPGLHFAGNYRGGISVGDCIVNGLELGKSLH